jgi:peptide/nickel transport system ATP-binding protein
MQESSISLEHLSVAYGNQKVLDDVSLLLEKGQILGIAGQSGSGKTTLGLAIPGLLSGSAQVMGKLQLQGQTIDLSKPAALAPYRGKHIGYIAQEPASALNPVLTCGQQMAETMVHLLGLTGPAARQKALEWLQNVQITEPERTFHSYPHEQSGGQLQRVAIAMALCTNPSLVIADEPTTALDATVQKSVLDLLKSLQATLGTTMLFISHDTAVLRYMCSSVCYLEKGRLVGQTPVLEEKKEKRSVRENKSQVPVFESVINVSYPVGKSFWRTKPLSWLHAVEAVAVSLFAGQCLGVVGESGSGKSSLGRAIADQMGQAEGGAVIIDQHPAAALNPLLRVGRAVQEIVQIAHQSYTAQQSKEAALALLRAVGLGAEYYDRRPAQLSGGQKQRICIARALARAPKVLVCDEIISGLDPENRDMVLATLRTLQAQGQLAVMFISHDLGIVGRISDQIMVLHNGKLVEYGPADAIIEQPKEDYTKELLAAQLAP